MAALNSTQALDLLGKTVALVHHQVFGDVPADESHTAQVIAVVVPLPGARIGTSVLLDLPRGPEYFDLDDCTLLNLA